MRRLLLSLAVLTSLSVASIASAGPVAAGDPCFHDMSRPPVTEGTATVVKLDACAFFPTIAHVPVGTEVRFLNSDVVGHEIVGANLTWGHHDKILDRGDELGMKFTKAGIYPYTCMIHPGMTGAVIVGDAASAAVPPGGAAVDEPGAGAGAPVQQPAGPAPATTAVSSVVVDPVAAVGVAIATLVALLGASVAMRRRRSNVVRPTA